MCHLDENKKSFLYINYQSHSLKVYKICCMYVLVENIDPHIPHSQAQAGIDFLQGRLHTMCFSSAVWTHSASCCLCWIEPPPIHLCTPPNPSPPRPLIFPFSSSSLSFSPLPPFSVAWDGGRAMTEVSAQVTVILSCRSVPTGPGVDTFLPFLSPHQSVTGVLRIHIPAHQELSLSSITGSCYIELWWERGLCECFSLSNPSSFLPLIQIRLCLSVSFFLVCLLICSPFLLTVCVYSALFFSLYTSQVRLNLPLGVR